MCVILLAEKARTSEAMVGKAYLTNEHGAGIAWRETIDGVVKVRWKKGLDMEEIQHMCATVPLPYVAHFRIPTCGGTKDSLTHPFPISADASTALEGVTEGGVLFHNGGWSDWRTFSLSTASQQPTKFPRGDWSDSRAMAWNAFIYGEGILELINEKVVVFTPDRIELYNADAWDEVENVYVSNKHWQHRAWPPYTQVHKPTIYLPNDEMDDDYSHAKHAKNEQLGGAVHLGTFRTPPRGDVICTEEDIKEPIEKVTETLSSTAEEGSERFVNCIRENLDPPQTPRPRLVKGNGTLIYNEEELPSLAEQKAWALSLCHAKPVGSTPADMVEHLRRIEQSRKGIIHLGSH